MLIGSDSHIGLNNDNPPNTVLPVKCVDIRTRLFELLDVAVSRKLPLIIAGDVFDKENPPSWAHDLFNEFLDAVVDKKVRLIIIPGNHDCGSVWAALVVARRLYDRHESEITIVLDNPYVFEYDKMSICVFPHLPKRRHSEIIDKYGTIKEFIKDYTGKTSFDVLVTHAHVDGAVSSSETELMESGTALHFVADEWPSFKIGVFGHVHKHQHLSVKRSTIIYPGSLVMCDYGERKDEKGFITLKRKGKLIDWSFERFTSVVTQYKQIKIDLLTKDEFKVSDKQLKTLSGYLLKVIVHTDDLAKVDEVEIRKMFNKYSHVVRFERVHYQAGKTAIEAGTDDVIFSGIAYDKLLKTWLDKKEGVSEATKKLALKIGKEVLNHA
jgi:DNA repair exonuclease SbcCD nuclease subunit